MIKKYLNHLHTCKSCCPASVRYCDEAIELKLEYEANYICSLHTQKLRQEGCENFKRVRPDLYQRLREKIRLKYEELSQEQLAQ